MCGRGSNVPTLATLGNHDFGRLDDRDDGVAFLELQLIGAFSSNDRINEVLADPDCDALGIRWSGQERTRCGRIVAGKRFQFPAEGCTLEYVKKRLDGRESHRLFAKYQVVALVMQRNEI